MKSRHWFALLLTLPLMANAAGPRDGPGFYPPDDDDADSKQEAPADDNPLLKPKIPVLPDLYGDQPETREQDSADEATALPPAPVAPRRPLRELAAGESRATPAMRSELQRQLSEFHAHSGQPERALATLLTARQRGWITLDGNRAALHAARLYRQLDLPFEAERFYTSLPDWMIPQEERQQFLLDRVQSHYNRGGHRAAGQLLARLGTPANPDIANRAQSLRLRILMTQGRYGSINEIYEEQLGKPRSNLYTRYNLGVSLIAAGETGKGIGQLDELGSIPAIDPEPLALRDRANLSLGWAFLQADQGATARPFFRRIRIDGPFANRALLALGWALLAPDGEPQKKVIARLENCLEDPAQILQSTTAVMRRPAREPCGKPKIFRYNRDLEFEASGGGPRLRLQDALAVWDKLVDRPGHDAAVQEALLARGYALEQLGQLRAAADAYRLATRRLEDEQQRMREQRQAALADPLSILDTLPPGQSVYLNGLTSRPQIRETRQALMALTRYAGRLQDIESRLQALQSTGQPGGRMPDIRQRLRELQARQRSLQNSFTQVLSRLIEQEYQQREEQLNTYLRRARLALADLYTQR